MGDINKTDKNNRMTYKNYIEFNESLGRNRENLNLDRKSEIVKILKPKESKSLTDNLLIDVKFPLGYTFSIAGKDQIQDIKIFEKLFTLSIKVCDSNNNELNPESRIIIHKKRF